jgi:hypothetical protein
MGNHSSPYWLSPPLSYMTAWWLIIRQMKCTLQKLQCNVETKFSSKSNLGIQCCKLLKHSSVRLLLTFSNLFYFVICNGDLISGGLVLWINFKYCFEVS